VLGAEGFLIPGDIERFQLAADAQGRGHVGMVATVDIHHEGDGLANLLPDGFDELEIIGGIMRVLADFDFHGAEAAFYEATGSRQRVLQAAKAQR
jgi:hypothetical protein